ncbi:MAG: hypothetical protein ACXVB9_19400 [Bdellovibrionota bacterium]
MEQNKDKMTKKESFTHKAGDKIERVGQKLREKGATKLGDAIYKAGNKIEHSRDKK